MNLEILNRTGFLSSVSNRPIKNIGHSYVFKADIYRNDGTFSNEYPAYVKILNDDHDGLLHEAIGFLIGSYLKYNTPMTAGFIKIDTTRLPQKPDWLLEDEVYGWFSEEIEPFRVHPRIDLWSKCPEAIKANRAAFKRILEENLECFAKITLFDELFQNADRNLGNVIPLLTKELAIIDHEELFSKLSYRKNKSGKLKSLADLAPELTEDNRFKSAKALQIDMMHQRIDGIKKIMDTELSRFMQDSKYLEVIDHIETSICPSSVKQRIGVLL